MNQPLIYLQRYYFIVGKFKDVELRWIQPYMLNMKSHTSWHPKSAQILKSSYPFKSLALQKDTHSAKEANMITFKYKAW